MWAIITIGVVCALILLLCCGCIIKKCFCKKRKKKDGKKGLKGWITMHVLYPFISPHGQGKDLFSVENAGFVFITGAHI